MNFGWKRLLFVVGAMVLAGCAGQLTQKWSFRYEDRAAIADLTSKLEAVTANLLAEVQQPMVAIGMARPEETDSVRFFASEVKRFRLAVQKWQPQTTDDVSIGYNRMVERWNDMRQRMAAWPAKQEIRSRIQMCNLLVSDLGRYAAPTRGLTPAAAGTPPAR